MSDHSPEISIEIASAIEHQIVVDMLCELIDELDPTDEGAKTKARMDNDTRIALASDQICVFLFKVDGALAGLARADILSLDPIFRLRENNRCGYVDQMYIRKDFRGKRHGATLLNRCEEWFREQGVQFCILHAAPKAIRFYARSGYQPNREMFKKL